MSEREELEGPAERKDPLDTKTLSKIAISSFTAWGIIFLFWPFWRQLFIFIILRVFLFIIGYR